MQLFVNLNLKNIFYTIVIFEIMLKINIVLSTFLTCNKISFPVPDSLTCRRMLIIVICGFKTFFGLDIYYKRNTAHIKIINRSFSTT